MTIASDVGNELDDDDLIAPRQTNVWTLQVTDRRWEAGGSEPNAYLNSLKLPLVRSGGGNLFSDVGGVLGLLAALGSIDRIWHLEEVLIVHKFVHARWSRMRWVKT